MLYKFQSSGRCALGSHWPNSSRSENDALFGPRLFLVTPPPAEDGVVAAFLEHPQQGEGLEPVAGRARDGLLDDGASVDVLLHRADNEPDGELFHLTVAVVENLGKVVPGVDVHDRERDALGRARLRGQVEKDSGVLSPGEEKCGTLEFGDHLADYVDRLGREGVEVRETVSHRFGDRLAVSTRRKGKRPAGNRFRCRLQA